MDPTDPHLLRRLLGGLVAATLGGCDVTWPPTGDGWEAARCADGTWSPIDDFQTAIPWDYLAIASAGVDFPARTEVEAGTACGGATDAVTCAEALAQVEAEVTGSHIRTTAGDTVRAWSGAGEVAALLAPIDTPSEALALAWAEGDHVTCDDTRQTAVRESEDGGWEVVSTHYTQICSPVVRVRTLRHVAEDGTVTELAEQVLERSMACIGRRPPGLEPLRTSPGTLCGQWLARAAALEASSVPAFLRLADELEALGAPADLTGACRAAADDERRHARVVGALAHRFGVPAAPPVINPPPSRDLEALALDNAVEGCVRETWGALVGAWQAATAGDARVARALGAVADDEASHAALAWRIAAWAEPRLDAAARARVRRAQAAAVAALREAAAAPIPADLAGPLGLPDRPAAAALLDGLDRALWRAAA